MSTALKHNLEVGELRKKPRLGEKFAWWVFERKTSAANDCFIREKPEVKLRLVSGKLFPGQYFDQETGLYYNYFRDYDPTTGRYVQSDPIGLEGGLNTYAYVDANPVNRDDEFGLAADTISPYPIPVPGWPTIIPWNWDAPLFPDTGLGPVLFPARGNVADTQVVGDYNDYASAERQCGREPEDRCKWLERNKNNYGQKQYKATAKAWGCRRSRNNR